MVTLCASGFFQPFVDLGEGSAESFSVGIKVTVIVDEDRDSEFFLEEGSEGDTVPERREVGKETAYDAVGIVSRTREGEADRDRFLAIESIDDRSETQDHGLEAQVKVIGI